MSLSEEEAAKRAAKAKRTRKANEKAAKAKEEELLKARMELKFQRKYNKLLEKQLGERK